DHYLANYAELLKKWDSVLDEKGVQKVEIADSEIEAFRAQAADPIREAWIADMEAQGLPGQELYDLVIKTLNDHRSGS
ncbi:MAG: C4-dicarboxylate ABC transporter substrate-binding protein, partial [Pseudomonadota bacterium]